MDLSSSESLSFSPSWSDGDLEVSSRCQGCPQLDYISLALEGYEDEEDVLASMFAAEVRNQPKPLYVEEHPYLTAAHRLVLVEWQQLVSYGDKLISSLPLQSGVLPPPGTAAQPDRSCACTGVYVSWLQHGNVRVGRQPAGPLPRSSDDPGECVTAASKQRHRAAR